MAAAGPREPARDLYELLGVARDASRGEIALAWRRRARAEHPDARRGDDDAPARFRALAEAWRVLGDPGRRAAYDQGLAPARPSAPTPVPVRVTVRRPPGPAAAHPEGGPLSPGGPPLVAGPVRVEGGPAQEGAGAWDEEGLRLALLAALALRARRGRPW